MIIGEKVRQAIEASNLEIKTIAELLGMSQANLYRIFKRDTMEIKYLVRLCEILKLEPSHFFDVIPNAHSKIQFQNSMVKQVEPNLKIEKKLTELENELALLMVKNKALEEKLKITDELLKNKDQIIEFLTIKKEVKAKKA